MSDTAQDVETMSISTLKEYAAIGLRSVRGSSENDRWWQAFCAAQYFVNFRGEATPAGVASQSADWADAAIDEAKKRGRL